MAFPFVLATHPIVSNSCIARLLVPYIVFMAAITFQKAAGMEHYLYMYPLLFVSSRPTKYIFTTRGDPRWRCAEGQSSSASTRGQIKISPFWASNDKARSLVCQKVQKRASILGVKNLLPFVANMSYFWDPFLAVTKFPKIAHRFW